jgi:hypothetical protein
MTSGVFSLSQNISNLENQKIYFSKIQSTDNYLEFDIKLLYLETIQNLDKLLSEEMEEKEYEQLVHTLNLKLQEDEVLSSFKLNMDFIDVYKEMYLLENNVAIGKIKDIDLASLKESNTYLLSLIGTYQNEKYNVGDLCFKDKASEGEKFILRSLSSFIPISCIFLSWLIHHKYFKIDQKFYQKILNSIEEKK